ncbi:MAG: FUSC family protein [Tissierellaceae bacterium]|jgi:uncharacterized membrane protein YgaE (UPF0421/DUF939 family)|nr:aromatic acid exporter family protein [Tissierellia bacterium]
MQHIKKYKIGMRTLKTGLSVAVSLLISELLNLKNPSLVGIAAIVSMQSSVNESFVAGKNRILGTFVGALVGLIFSYLLPYNYFFLGLGIVVVIYLHNIFGWSQSLSLSAIVFLVVFLYQEDSRLIYALNRLLDTFIGVVVSMLINYFIVPPHNRQSFVYLKDNIYVVIKGLIHDMITNVNQLDNSVFREKLEKYNDSFDGLKKELDMDSSKRTSSKSALYVVTVLDRVEKNLLTLLELNIIPILNEENQELFKKLYSTEYVAPQREPTDIDIIYNHHANKIFNKLLEIESHLK